MAKEPKTPKEPKVPKAPKTSGDKKGFFARAGDFLGSVARKPWMRIAQITFATLLVVMLVFYGAAVLFAEKSGFTIQVDNSVKDGEGKAMISLSETEDFTHPTVRLDAGGLDNITNISVLDLPEQLESDGGSHNGENYLAYTFYAKNSGDTAAPLTAELDIKSVLNGADEAIRVRVYKNGQATTYAKAAADGQPEYGTVPFSENRKIFSVTEEKFEPNEIIKYTFVIWLEGDDPECLDDIRGGNVNMSLTFSVGEKDQP